MEKADGFPAMSLHQTSVAEIHKLQTVLVHLKQETKLLGSRHYSCRKIRSALGQSWTR
jgi:hypothetical protein